jgi:hypothetical protein
LPDFQVLVAGAEGSHSSDNAPALSAAIARRPPIITSPTGSTRRGPAAARHIAFDAHAIEHVPENRHFFVTAGWRA